MKDAKDLKKELKEKGIIIDLDPKIPEKRFDELRGDNIRITTDILTIKLIESKPAFSIMNWAINWNPRQPIFNSRIETIRSEKRWATIFKNSRCLIPADSFYEFRPPENDPPDTVKYKKEHKIKRKTKFEIGISGASGFMIGAIFVFNKDKEYCSMITTEPHKDMKQIPHNRSPYILDYKDSLEFLQGDPDFLLDSISHYPDDKKLEIIQASEI